MDKITEEERQQAVKRLGQLVDGEPDLYIGNDEKVLLRYLYFASFNVDNAFDKLKYVFKLKRDHSDWYAQKRDPEIHDKILKRKIHTMLEDRDRKGRRVYLINLGNVVVGEFLPWLMFQTDDLWLELAMDEEETQKNGLAFIIDMAGISWKFMRYFTPTIVTVSTRKAENIPLRSIQYHLINTGVLLNTMVSIVFPFLSPATKENIHFHKGDMKSLHKFIDPEILPVEYGGSRPSIDYEMAAAKYLDPNQERLSELLSYGYKKNK